MPDHKTDPFGKILRKWRGKRVRKRGAAVLGLPLATYSKYEYGKRTPNKLAMVELLRRMEENKFTP
jgi:hypothetical protein